MSLSFRPSPSFLHLQFHPLPVVLRDHTLHPALPVQLNRLTRSCSQKLSAGSWVPWWALWVRLRMIQKASPSSCRGCPRQLTSSLALRILPVNLTDVWITLTMPLFRIISISCHNSGHLLQFGRLHLGFFPSGDPNIAHEFCSLKHDRRPPSRPHADMLLAYIFYALTHRQLQVPHQRLLVIPGLYFASLMSNRSSLICCCPQGFLESCWCWCARPSPCQTWWCCFTDSTSRSAVSSHNCSSSSPRTTLMAESQLMRTSLSVQIQFPDVHGAEAHELVWTYSTSHSRFDFSSLFQRCFFSFFLHVSPSRMLLPVWSTSWRNTSLRAL